MPHTPGPWKIGMPHGHNPETIYAEDGEREIASVCGVPMHTTLAEVDRARFGLGLANAALIAATPDLLEALFECMKDTFTAADGMSEAGKRSPAGARYRQAIAAIAKATPVDQGAQ